MNAVATGAMFGKTDAAEVARLKDELPAWTVVIGLAGAGYFPAERVQVQELDLKRLVQQCGVTLRSGLSNVRHRGVGACIRRLSPAKPIASCKYKGACQEIFFLTTLDKAPQFIDDGLRRLPSGAGIRLRISASTSSRSTKVFRSTWSSICRSIPATASEAEKVKRIYAEASEAWLRKAHISPGLTASGRRWYTAGMRTPPACCAR